MLRQSSSRNQRSKGYKVKNILQICVLFAICIWLLYQIKHSHDKKVELEERNSKITSGVEDAKFVIPKLGRKVLPEVGGHTPVEKGTHDEGEEDGNEEGEEEESEVKHEEDEDEVDEVKDSREDGIDENDRGGADEDAGLAEESAEDVEKDDQSDESNSGDHDSAEANSQEAREEHYRGDDASSAVIKGNEGSESEAGNLGIGNINEGQAENTEKDVGVSNETIVANYGSKGNDSSALLETGRNHTHDDTSMAEASLVESNKHDVELHTNSTMVESVSETKEQSKSTVEIPSPILSETTNSSAAVISVGNGSSLQNLTASMESSHDHNSSIEMGTSREDVNSTTVELGRSDMQQNLIEQGKQNNPSNTTGGSVQRSDSSLISRESKTSEPKDRSTNLGTVTEEKRDTQAGLSTLTETQTGTHTEDVAAQ